MFYFHLIIIDIPPTCTELNTVRTNNTEFIVDETYTTICLHCVDSREQHDTSTTWEIRTKQRTTLLSNSYFLPGVAEVREGFLILYNIRLTISTNPGDTLLTICSRTDPDIRFNIRIYQQGSTILIM